MAGREAFTSHEQSELFKRKMAFLQLGGELICAFR